MREMKKKTVFSGMRPTGKLHLGHWVGALSNWVKLQDQYRCFFSVVDWHAFMSEYKDPSKIKANAFDNVCDWLAYGLDPERSVIFIQSHVPAHLELEMILSALVPLGWLFRCPTFKEQIKQLKDKEINTYAFLGYPVLQCSDIILYNTHFVPVGDDQLPHLELCREVVRRFHSLYKCDIFIEPQAILTPTPRLLGLDGRKMSKSYQNYIELCEEEKSLGQKVLSMFTDPARKKKNDPGHPDICNVFSYHVIFSPEIKDQVRDWCVNAKKGCRECKSVLLKALEDFIAPRREKKRNILKKKSFIEDILNEGSKTANKVSGETLIKAKNVLGL